MTDNARESDTNPAASADTQNDTQDSEQPQASEQPQQGAKRVQVTYADKVADNPADNAADNAADNTSQADSHTDQADKDSVKTIDATAVDTAANNEAASEQERTDSDAFSAFHEASSADAEIEILRNELDQAHAELSTLKEQQAELEVAKKQAQEMKDKFLRARADLENYRRRAAKDVERARDSGADSVILAVVPVYDDLGRALDAGVKNPSSLIPGIEAVRAGLERNLEALGIKKVGETGEPFDPTYHEALSSIPSPDDDHKGKIAQVFQAGFAKDERLIRPAQVVVYRED
jgi:molecular chaperone GrpE